MEKRCLDTSNIKRKKQIKQNDCSESDFEYFFYIQSIADGRGNNISTNRKEVTKMSNAWGRQHQANPSTQFF